MKRIFHLWIMFSAACLLVVIVMDHEIKNFLIPAYWMGVMVLGIWLDAKGFFFKRDKSNDNI